MGWVKTYLGLFFHPAQFLLRFFYVNFTNKMILSPFSFLRVFLLRFRQWSVSYGKRWKLHNTGLHIRRGVSYINRTPCPVGLRKEQIDYRARTDPLQLLCAHFFLLFRFFVSLLFFHGASFALCARDPPWLSIWRRRCQNLSQVTKIIAKGVYVRTRTRRIEPWLNYMLFTHAVYDK